MITALTSDEYTLETKPGEEGSDPFFTGTIQKAFMNVPTSLARSVAGVKSTDADNANRLDDIDTSRQSISSVSIDDEAVSLVQYNQALTAAARFMTAVDECLQTIISSMGVAGRG
jgi:flagellar hook-associated protein 1 FlgK